MERAAVEHNDLGARLISAERVYNRYGPRSERFIEAIGIDEEEYMELLQGNIVLADETIENLAYLGFSLEWILGEGDPKKPKYHKDGGL